MQPEEGYIKFDARWKKTAPLDRSLLGDLLQWRQKLYDLQLIGAYEDGIGYGNISCRYRDADNHPEAGSFIITGSATGRLPRLDPRHFSLVTRVDPASNNLYCRGPVVASSESMSHAALYRQCPWVNGVIHVHSLVLWEKLRYELPTTPADVAYGSPEMNRAIIRLLRDTDLPQKKIFVTAGHREGIFTFGSSLGEAGEILLKYFSDLR